MVIPSLFIIVFTKNFPIFFIMKAFTFTIIQWRAYIPFWLCRGENDVRL